MPSRILKTSKLHFLQPLGNEANTFENLFYNFRLYVRIYTVPGITAADVALLFNIPGRKDSVRLLINAGKLELSKLPFLHLQGN